MVALWSAVCEGDPSYLTSCFSHPPPPPAVQLLWLPSQARRGAPIH